jgi:hypothetical protein
MLLDLTNCGTEKRRLLSDFLADNEIPFNPMVKTRTGVDYADLCSSVGAVQLNPLRWNLPDRQRWASPVSGFGYAAGLAREAKGLQMPTDEEFRAQYLCTPKSEHACLVDAMLNATNMSRQYLEELHSEDLVWLARNKKLHNSLWRPLQKLLDSCAPADYSEVQRLRFLELRGACREYWKDHHGGPCPVRHERVEVMTRSGSTSVGWPEGYVWHWTGPMTDSPSSIDVLFWRKAD